MIRSGFFNSIEGDRTYNAEDMSSMFEGIITDGVLQGAGAELKVTPCSPAGRRVAVSSGKAILAGKWVRNTDEHVLALEPSDTDPRIDLVVAELDYTGRAFVFAVKKGTPAAMPKAPEPEDSSVKKELPLARIHIAANATEITEECIIDERPFAAVNNVIFPSRNIKRYVHSNAYVQNGLQGVDPEEDTSAPGQYNVAEGTTVVTVIDCVGYYQIEVDVNAASKIAVPQGGIWVAMILPENLTFPETASASVECSSVMVGGFGTRTAIEKTDLYISQIGRGRGSYSGGILPKCGYVKVDSLGSNNAFNRIKASFLVFEDIKQVVF